MSPRTFVGVSFQQDRSEIRSYFELPVNEMDDLKQKQNVTTCTGKGGIRTMPFIIANESFEKVASYGLLANMILYLISDYNLSSATGVSILFIWSAVGNFMPLIGAFLSDSYLGRFRVIAIGTIISLTGMNLLFFTAIFRDARPPSCDHRAEACVGPNPGQLTLLFSSFVLMAIGAGGIRPCSIAFGADQIDNPKDPNNKRTLQTYFNLYYSSVAISIMISISLIVYIQDKFGWVVGFAIPAGLMFASTIMFLMGAPLYIKVEAHRSLFTSFAQVVTVAFKNKHLAFPPDDSDGWYHHRSGSKFVIPSQKLRFLNKACIIRNPEREINTDGEAEDGWKLCTVEQVEELKAVVRVLPIWSSGIMISVTISQQAFPVLQALTMDRRFITDDFKIPAGSYGVFALLALTIWVPVYDRLLIPLIAKFTKHKHGLTLKQRMGIGLALSCAGMLVSGIVEKRRREEAIRQGLVNNPVGVVNMSGLWLVPQNCLVGLAEAFNAIGQIEFYYSQFPKSMSSIGVALLALGMGVGNLVGSVIVGVVNQLSERGGNDSWVSDNINKGHYDYYYFLLAGLSAANFIYFLLCSCLYGPSESDDMHKLEEDEADETSTVSKASPLIYSV
uniref:Uncharacterized protein n=1 Tax=Kalanchoe fedtschenkoi TaxID=63787 RepID=A0A7N0U0W1_KALFE